MTNTDTPLTARENKELDAALAMYWPWIIVNEERAEVEGTLSTGRKWWASMPIKAAVELEEAGFQVKVVGTIHYAN